MINLLKIIVLLSVSFCYNCVEQTDEIVVDDDSIIIDASSTGSSPETPSVIRNGRQIYLTNLPSASWIQQSTIQGEGSPCVTSKGHIGACTSFRNCYPYFKLPDLTLWDAWILGNYDRCSFLSDKGQAFGVCCSNPITTTTASPETDEESDYNIDGGGGAGGGSDDDDDNNNNFNDEDDHYDGGHNSGSNSSHEEYPTDNRYSSWPPPFITHPPDHTAATHPPLSGYPPTAGGGRPPATKPTTTRRPPTQWPTKPSKPSTTYPGWPPTTTTKKPITAGWPSRPTRPPTSPQYPGWPPTSTPTKPTTTTESSVITGDASCGAKNGYQDQERIVGGTNADPNEWPWIAVLFNGGRQFCGGSLVSNIHILTAAHCVAHFTSWDVARLTVRLGDHNIKTDTEVKHIEKRIKRVVRHRGFDSRTLYNDVAVLTMESPVEFTRTIRPLCLPSSGTRQLYNGKTGTVIGWGSLAENGPQPAILQKVSIPIWSNTECKHKYGSAAPGGIVESMVCAGRATKDSCSGDSGGPLMVNEGRWTQVGIVSWGIGCGKGQYPGVYTRVTHFMPWITKNMKEQKKSIL